MNPPLKDWPVAKQWTASAKELNLHADSAKVLSPSDTPETGSVSSPLSLVAITPCRVIDTRVGQNHTGQFGPPALAGYSARTFDLTATMDNPCTIPTTAVAYSLNLTVIPQTTIQFLSVYPAGTSYPGVSTLNDPNGGIVANAAIVPAGTDGGIKAVADQATDLIVDINGYFTLATGARTSGGFISAGGSVVVGPPGLTSSVAAGSGSSNCGGAATCSIYTLNFAAGSFSPGIITTPVVTPFNSAAVTIDQFGIAINGDGSATLTVAFSANTAFTFIAVQNN